ncbi:MAG: hypothetical protein AAF490_28735, partial [Chloroflexota bacterium]
MKNMPKYLILLLIALLFLAACGGGGDAGSDEPADEPATSEDADAGEDEAMDEDMEEDMEEDEAMDEDMEEMMEELVCEDAIGCVEVSAGDPIRVASALVITGPNESLGLDSQYGVEIALADRGEILGHSLELQAEDDGCSAEGGQT